MSTPGPIAKTDWTDPEKWVWEKVCKGEIADFNQKYQPDLNPSLAEGWTANRMISNAFLETVLLQEPYKSALPRRGLRIAGAWINEKIDLSNARISSEWWIDKSRFEQPVTLYSVNASNFISFARSFFNADLNMNYLATNQVININGLIANGKLTMSNMSVEKGLLFGDGAECKDANLIGAKIGQSLNLNDLKVIGTLDMTGISIGSDLMMSDIDVTGKIRLVGGKVKGQAILCGANVTETINMNGLFVDSDLFMCEGVKSSNVELTGARVGGQIDLSGAKISQKFEGSGVVVGEDLLIEEGEFGEVNLIGAKIGAGADMSSVKIFGPFRMDGIVINQDLFMNEKALFQSVKMISAEIGGELNLESASIAGDISMSSVVVKSHVFFDNSVIAGEVNLRNAKIQGTLHLIGTNIGGKLILDRISVTGSVYMRDGAQFMQVEMRGGKIDVDLEMTGIFIKESLLMNDLSVSGRLYMRNGSHFANIDMIGARIGAVFSLTNVTVADLFEMQSIEASGNIFISNCEFKKRVSIIDSKINGSIVTYSNTLSNLDLGGTTVQRELQIGIPGEKNIWTGQSLINLSNANVRSFSDGGEDSWPANIVLEGFAYSDVGQGARKESKDDISNRRIEWFIGWLTKMEPYSWPPYYYLAQRFDKAGESGKANKILYASKEREREHARKHGRLGKWIGLTLLYLTIGYGYGTRYFRSLIWVLLLLIIGMLVIGSVEEGKMKSASLLDQVGFSLDKLLPIIKINDEYKFDFHGLQLAYFYLHEILGFVLGSFVVAGMSGITKR